MLWLAAAVARPIGADPQVVLRTDEVDLGVGNHPVAALVDDVVLVSRNACTPFACPPPGIGLFETATYDLDLVPLSSPVIFGDVYEKGGSEVSALPDGDFLVGAPADDTLRMYELDIDGSTTTTCDVGPTDGARLPTVAIDDHGNGVLLWKAVGTGGLETYWITTFDADDPCFTMQTPIELVGLKAESPPSLVSTRDGFLAGLGLTAFGLPVLVGAVYSPELDVLEWRTLGLGHRPELASGAGGRALTVRRTPNTLWFEVERGKRTLLDPVKGRAIVHPLDEHYLVVWDDKTAIWARIFDADGAPVHDRVLVSEVVGGTQRRPRILPIADDEAWVFWEQAAGTPFHVKGRRIRW